MCLCEGLCSFYAFCLCVGRFVEVFLCVFVFVCEFVCVGVIFSSCGYMCGVYSLLMQQMKIN